MVFFEGDVLGAQAEEVGLGGIHLVEGLKDHEAVSRGAQGAQDRGQGFGGACGDGDLAVGVGTVVVELIGVVGDGFSEFWEAEGEGVLVEAVAFVLKSGQDIF